MLLIFLLHIASLRLLINPCNMLFDSTLWLSERQSKYNQILQIKTLLTVRIRSGLHCCRRGVFLARSHDVFRFQSSCHWQHSLCHWRGVDHRPIACNLLLCSSNQDQAYAFLLWWHRLDFDKTLFHWVYCGECRHHVSLWRFFRHHSAVLAVVPHHRSAFEASYGGAVGESCCWLGHFASVNRVMNCGDMVQCSLTKL